MNSTVGRPRKLTDAQVQEILVWHRARRTMAQMARDYGVSRSVIENAIKRAGVYKLPSPELREGNQQRLRRKRKQLRELHFI